MLRRILRRAVRHASQTFGVQEPCLFEMVLRHPEPVRFSPNWFGKKPFKRPFTTKKWRSIARWVGAPIVARCSGSRIEQGIDGVTAFRCMTPMDSRSTRRRSWRKKPDCKSILKYESEMEAARERSRRVVEPGTMLIFLQNDLRLWPSVSRQQMTHAEIPTASALLGALLIAGDLVEEAKTGDEVSVLDQTNSYAEMGGQVGDTGTPESEGICFGSAPNAVATSCFMGVVESGTLRTGQPLRTCLDVERRSGIEAHHGDPPAQSWIANGGR